MCAQGAVWYLSFFYVQVFLTKSLGVPEPTKDALILGMTVVSAPLYVFFGWLSDRSRPQAGDARRNAARANCLLSGLPRHRDGGQPGAGRGAGEAPGRSSRQCGAHAPCSSIPSARAVSTRSCDIAKSLLASAGISYANRSFEDDRTIIAVGVQQIEVPDGRGLDASRTQGAEGRYGQADQGGARRRGLSGKARP